MNKEVVDSVSSLCTIFHPVLHSVGLEGNSSGLGIVGTQNLEKSSALCTVL